MICDQNFLYVILHFLICIKPAHKYLYLYLYVFHRDLTLELPFLSALYFLYM
jgi:hypothetical protein